ncbi:8996_t:CDS:2 [Gigaspora rosea]|nr:8996_t:CDS:2 [Gigaspora rosea]
MEKVEDNKLTLEKERSNLKNKLVLKQILEILKIVGLTISYFGGPTGIVCDVLIKGGVHMADTFISKDNNKLKFEIPPEIKVSLEKMEKMVENKGILKYKIEIETQLEELSQECNKHPDFSNIKKKIQKLLNNINSKIIKEIKDELEQTQKKLELKKNENASTSQKAEAELEIIQNFNTAIKKIEIAIELYDKYEKDKKELDNLTYSIKQADDDVKKLLQYEEKINQSKIDKKSHIFLDLTEWKVQSSLKDIKYNIQQISGGFESQKDITYYMEKLDGGITTLIKIYDRIQDYYDQANLARYIANIHSPKITKIEDEQLNDAINYLNLKIRTNLILWHFKRATSAFKQMVFPLTNLPVLCSLSDDDILETIRPMHSIGQIGQKHKISLYKSDECLIEDKYNGESSQLFFVWENKTYSQERLEQKIRTMHSIVQKHKIALYKSDECLIEDKFNAEFPQPFFVWENKTYSQEISKLLNGEEVTIYADITKSDHNNKNAIKFNEIGIKFRFKPEDKAEQNNMDNELNNFILSMCHLGDSYYKYNDKFYIIRNTKYNIICGFKKNNNGEPFPHNEIYTKIKNGELMLSPYTRWKLKLERYNNNANFSKLNKYEKVVDLELVGLGKYIKNSNDLSHKVEKYYKEYKIDLPK